MSNQKKPAHITDLPLRSRRRADATIAISHTQNTSGLPQGVSQSIFISRPGSLSTGDFLVILKLTACEECTAILPEAVQPHPRTYLKAEGT